MILKAIPYLLIILPLIGFFIDPEAPTGIKSEGRQNIADAAYILCTIPWQAKGISIIIGVIWILLSGKNEDK